MNKPTDGNQKNERGKICRIYTQIRIEGLGQNLSVPLREKHLPYPQPSEETKVSTHVQLACIVVTQLFVWILIPLLMSLKRYKPPQKPFGEKSF